MPDPVFEAIGGLLLAAGIIAAIIAARNNTSNTARSTQDAQPQTRGSQQPRRSPSNSDAGSEHVATVADDEDEASREASRSVQLLAEAIKGVTEDEPDLNAVSNRIDAARQHLERSEHAVREALQACQELHDEVTGDLVNAESQATIANDANTHRNHPGRQSVIDGLTAADIDEVTGLDDDLFASLKQRYQDADSDEDRLRVYVEAYQAATRLPQFIGRYAKHPRAAERLIRRGRSLEEVFDTLQAKLDMVNEELPGLPDEDRRAASRHAEREARLLHEVSKLVSSHLSALRDASEEMTAGGIDIGVGIPGRHDELPEALQSLMNNGLVSHDNGQNIVVDDVLGALADNLHDVVDDTRREAVARLLQMIQQRVVVLDTALEFHGSGMTLERRYDELRSALLNAEQD